MVWLFFKFINIASAAVLIQGITRPLETLSPFAIEGIEAYEITGYVLEPLARSNARTGEIIPVLAKSWTLDPKAKTFRVKLHENVKFHNGEPLTADDVKFTFDAYFKPEFKAQIWQAMWAEIESVKVIDPLTVEFKMKNWRYQTFESTLTSLRVLPKSFYGDADLMKFRGQIVGTGPFKFMRYERGLELEPNLNWRGGPAPKAGLLIKVANSPAMAKELIEKGELDFYAAGPVRVPDSKFVRTFKSGLGSGLWIDLNMSHPLFRDSNVRKALGLLWRRKTMSQKIFAGKMRPAADFFSPETDIHPAGRIPADDPATALKILKSENWNDSDKDGVLDKDGRKFEFTILVKTPEQERWATFFQNDAKACGIRVHLLKLEDDGQWLNRLRENRFEAAAGGGGLINEPNALVWQTNAFYNFQKFSDAEVDQHLQTLESEFDLKKRRLILRKTIARINEIRPFVPGLATAEETFLLSKRIVVDPENPAQAWSWKLR